MLKVDPLIRTKLHLPFIRPGLVSRPRLQEQIAQGLCGPLTLITAPAGFGKTTLAAACVTGCGMAAWLSLDKNDNQPGRFLNYLVAALQAADPAIGSEAAQLLSAAQDVPAEAVLTSLINALDAAGREMVLVLDDYQVINSPAVHEALAFLLDHRPKTFHLVIVTRSDPPLPLARLRARGQMVELRAADLRFTETEAEQFLKVVMGLHLDAHLVAVLEERTEGWVAGLQMAALSMRDRKDLPGFIEGFSGTNRYILDFLMEEVLAHQPPEIQRFLLYTSILERLTAPLCDALLADENDPIGAGGAHSEEPPRSRTASILAYLESANLFLIPLEDNANGAGGQWFRYHHLFSDLLRARLALSLEGDKQKRLHARASQWFEQNGFAEESIQHALAAGEYAEAARLVEAAAEAAWLGGQYASILSWVKALPIPLVRSRPWLCIWCAWAYTQMGISLGIQGWIDAAEQSLRNAAQDAPTPSAPDLDVPALLNEIAALNVFAVSFSKAYDRAIALAERVLQGPPLIHEKSAQFIRCNILHILSSMYFVTGQLQKAEQTCQETVALANRIGFPLRYIHAVNKLVLICKVTGRLARGDQQLDEAQSVLKQQGNSGYFAALQLQMRRIELLYEWNRLDEAQRLVDCIHNQGGLVEVPYLVVDFLNVQAALLLAKKEYTGAQNALNQAAALAQQSYIWEGLTWYTEQLQIRLWLQKGDVSLAAAWAAKPAENSPAEKTFASESRMLAQARIFLAQSAWQKAIAQLSQISATAEAGGRTGRLIEIHALRALALQGAGAKDQALAETENALALAAPEGYTRTFFDEGRPMQTLIARWLTHAGDGPVRDYAKSILSQWNAEPPDAQGQILPPNLTSPAKSTAGPEARFANDSLVEPLSPRELEVLRLIALGKTNEEIARQFVVTRGTIKSQAASIYRKLDVANRTEAVARARQLGIIP